MKNYYIYIEEITAKTTLLSTALSRPATACLQRTGHLKPTPFTALTACRIVAFVEMVLVSVEPSIFQSQT